MLRTLAAALIVSMAFPAFARSTTSAFLSRGWKGCDELSEAITNARIEAQGDEAAKHRQEDRVGASGADAHPLCQALAAGTKVEVVKKEGGMRCVNEFHSYGSRCLWLPESLLREPSPHAKN